MSTVINHNACVRTGVYILLGKRSAQECSCSHGVQCCSRTLLQLIVPHFSSWVSKTLTAHTSSTLQKTQEDSPPLFSLVFWRMAAGLTRPLLSYQQLIQFTLNILNTLSSTARTGWVKPTHLGDRSSNNM